MPSSPHPHTPLGFGFGLLSTPGPSAHISVRDDSPAGNTNWGLGYILIYFCGTITLLLWNNHMPDILGSSIQKGYLNNRRYFFGIEYYGFFRCFLFMQCAVSKLLCYTSSGSAGTSRTAGTAAGSWNLWCWRELLFFIFWKTYCVIMSWTCITVWSSGELVNLNCVVNLNLNCVVLCGQTDAWLHLDDYEWIILSSFL